MVETVDPTTPDRPVSMGPILIYIDGVYSVYLKSQRTRSERCQGDQSADGHERERETDDKK